MFILISSKFVIAKRTSKTRKNFIRKYRLQQSLIVLVTKPNRRQNRGDIIIVLRICVRLSIQFVKSRRGRNNRSFVEIIRR